MKEVKIKVYVDGKLTYMDRSAYGTGYAHFDINTNTRTVLTENQLVENALTLCAYKVRIDSCCKPKNKGIKK